MPFMMNRLSTFLACIASLLVVAAAGFTVTGGTQWGAACLFGALVLLAPSAVQWMGRRWDPTHHRTSG